MWRPLGRRAAAWLAAAAGAEALAQAAAPAPAADGESSWHRLPALGRRPPAPEVTSLHSHAVLKELIAAPAREALTKMEQFESMWDPGNERAPAPMPEVPAPSPQAEAPQDALAGRPGGGFCAGSPVIYDGPTLGWADCRTRCANHGCGFWSYWRDSPQHRCRLTTACARRERDPRHSVSAYRGSQDDGAAEEAAEPEAEPDPELQSPPGARQGCLSPQGTARKFAASPQSGWHNLGRVDSYINCSHTAGSKGYQNLVYNIGSVAKGRCYGFASDVPEVHQHGCEDAYCWLFGPACEPASRHEEEVQRLAGDSSTMRSWGEAAPGAAREAKQAVLMAVEARARADEGSGEEPRAEEAREGVRDAQEDLAHTIAEVARTVAEAGQAAHGAGEAGDRSAQGAASDRGEEAAEEDVMDMDATSEETVKGEVEDRLEAEHQAAREASRAHRTTQQDARAEEDAVEEEFIDMDTKSAETTEGEAEDAEEDAMRSTGAATTGREAEEPEHGAAPEADGHAVGVGSRRSKAATAEGAGPAAAERQEAQAAGQGEGTDGGVPGALEGAAQVAQESRRAARAVEAYGRRHAGDAAERLRSTVQEAKRQLGEAEGEEAQALEGARRRVEEAAKGGADAELEAWGTATLEALSAGQAQGDSGRLSRLRAALEEAVRLSQEARAAEADGARRHAGEAAERLRRTVREAKRQLDEAEGEEARSLEEAKRKVEEVAKGGADEELEAWGEATLEALSSDGQARGQGARRSRMRGAIQGAIQLAREARAVEDYGRRHAGDAAERLRRTMLEVKRQLGEAEGDHEGGGARALEEEARRKVEAAAEGGADAEFEAWGTATLEALADGQAQGDSARRNKLRAALEGAVQASQEARQRAEGDEARKNAGEAVEAPGEAPGEAVEDHGRRHAKDVIERIRRTVLETKRQIAEAEGAYEGEEARMLEEAKRRVEEVAKGGAEEELLAWGRAVLAASMSGKAQGEGPRERRARAALRAALGELAAGGGGLPRRGAAGRP